MTDTTFSVSDVSIPKRGKESVEYVSKLRIAVRRPIEQHWLPRNPIVQCDAENALLTAMRIAFYEHDPLRLSPDAMWINLARGFALHVNTHAEELRHRFVRHAGQEQLRVERPDFQPGRDNPWPEVFESFVEQIDTHTGGLSKLVRTDFSTTGPTERAAANLMAMDAFQTYFEYLCVAGCGIPNITLTGTIEDWDKLRESAQNFADYGLHDWVSVLDPILEQFCRAKRGDVDVDFWRSMFRFNSGSGPAVMTGWATALFPHLRTLDDQLEPNPYLHDWKERLAIDDEQHWRDRWSAPQGVGIAFYPNCMTSVPMILQWGDVTTDTRLIGGLIAVSQDEVTRAIEPECGWLIVYENPVDDLSGEYAWREQRLQNRE